MPPRACEYLTDFAAGTLGLGVMRFSRKSGGRITVGEVTTRAKLSVTNGGGSSFGKYPRSRIS